MSRSAEMIVVLTVRYITRPISGHANDCPINCACYIHVRLCRTDNVYISMLH